MRCEVSRLELDGAAQVGLCFGISLQAAQDGAAGNEESGLVGPGTKRGGELLVRFVRVPRRFQQQRKIVPGGEMLRPGRVLIAPGGMNLTVERRGAEVATVLTKRTGEDRYVPSVDALLRSAARAFGPGCLGVILTGMGDDGTEGVLEVKRRRGITIAESEESSVIFGMPKKAISSGAVDHVLPLGRISGAIVELFSKGNP